MKYGYHGMGTHRKLVQNLTRKSPPFTVRYGRWTAGSLRHFREMLKSRRSWHKSPYLDFITCVTNVNVVLTGKLIKLPSFWCASLRLSILSAVFVYCGNIGVRHFGDLVVNLKCYDLKYLFKIVFVCKVDSLRYIWKQKWIFCLFTTPGKTKVL